MDDLAPIRAPLIGFCDGNLRVFPTMNYAEAYIEPVDVENGEWEVFDGSGQLLEVSIEQQRTLGIWTVFSRSEEQVRIKPFIPPIYNRNRLRSQILTHFRNWIENEQPDDHRFCEAFEALSLDQLVNRAAELFPP